MDHGCPGKSSMPCNFVLCRVACHWALMGLEASNLTNLIDCSFVLSCFFGKIVLYFFSVMQTHYILDSFSLAFHDAYQPHSTLHLRIFMASEASHINKSDKHIFIHYRKLTGSMFLSETLPASG